MSVRLRSAVAVAAVVVSCVVGWASPPALAESSTQPTVADATSAMDEVTASEIAQAYGHDVVVSSEESPTVEIVAQPDGQLHMTQNTEPVRVQQAGDWKPIDTSLDVSSGVVKPQTPLVPVEFSAGGSDQPLARIETPSGQWVSQTWKLGALPAPTLTDDSATYADVLPDVDLELTATPTGMSEVLVVKNAAAAANPDLSSVKFGVDDGDLTTTQVAGGTSLSKSSDGSTQVAAPAPTWWDSSSSGASSDGPGGLGVPSPVPDSVTSTQVSLDASAALSQRPDVTYPAYIDPDYNVSTVVNWAFVDSAYPTTAYWHDSGASDPYQHVGYVDQYNSDDGHAHEARSFWTMDTSFLHGRKITTANFNTTEVYSFSCSPSPVELWLGDPATPSSTWQSQPAMGLRIGTLNVAYGYNASCPAQAVGFPVTSQVQDVATANRDTINFGLLVSNPAVNYSWKKFSSSANIQVWFDTKPTQPAYRSVSGCAFICGMGAYTKDNTPTLTGAADTSDRNTQLRYNFELYAGHSASPGSALYTYTGPPVDKGYPATPDQAKGTWTTPALADGDYEYRVRAWDTVQYSDWSGFFTFTVVHTRRPTLPTISLPTGGPLSTDKNSFAGYVGSTMETVTITPAASSNDPVYAYSFGMFPGSSASFGSYGDCSTDTVGGYSFACGGLGSGVPVRITPIDDISTFAVAVWDAAGNVATVDPTSGNPYASATFYAQTDATTPQNGHQWSTTNYAGATDCSAASTLADVPQTNSVESDITIGAHHPCWTTSTVLPSGASVPVLNFDGSASSAVTGASPHLIDTTNSFTAGAWVNITPGVANNTAETFLAQEGTNEDVFYLQFVKDAQGAGHFSFCLSNADTTAFAGDCVLSATPSGATWYFVAGEWDAVNHQMRLTVSSDGTATTPYAAHHRSSWSATGSVHLGEDRIGTTYRYFKGMVSDPFIASGILDSSQLSRVARHSLQAV